MQPLTFPAFRLLLTGRLADNLAHAIAPIALAFAVLDLGGTPSQLGIVLACRAIPTVLLILFGGVIADRWPRHLVLVVANLVGAVTQGLVAVLLLTGAAEIWSLAAIEVVNGAASAFLFPAASGLTAQTVPATQLQPANALLRLGHNAAFITGAAGGGLLVAAFGSGWAFALDSLLYVGGAALLSRIRLPRSDRLATGNVLRELKEGWVEFSSRTWLWVIVAVFAFFNAAWSGAFGTLGPVVADDTIGRAAWGMVLAAQALGMVAGGLIALRTRWERPLFVGTAMILLEAPLMIALGLHPQVVLLVALAFAAGIGIETFAVAWDVAMQSNVPEDKLSRVYAYDWFGSLLFIPVGQILAGPLAAGVGLREAIVASGVVVLLATVTALCVPSVRNLRRAEEVSETPAAV
jgi:MFS family permease